MRIKDFLPVMVSGVSLISFVSCGSNPHDIPLAQGVATQGGAAAADAMLAKGRAYQAAGKNGRALSTYKTVYNKYRYANAAAEARFSQGQILDRQGDLFKAFEAYQDVISRYPSSPRYATALSRQEAVAHAAATGVIKNNFLGMKTRISPDKVEKMLGHVRDNAPRAKSASKAQYAIGRIWQKDGNADKAIAAYHKLALDYPNSGPAPEALYQQGEILVIKAQRGNQNTAHVNRARDIYLELLRRYPRHSRAADARKRLAMLGGQDIQRSYETAEFYRKKGQSTSAVFYYKEVMLKAKSGTYYDRAKQRIAELAR